MTESEAQALAILVGGRAFKNKRVYIEKPEQLKRSCTGCAFTDRGGPQTRPSNPLYKLCHELSPCDRHTIWVEVVHD